MSRRRFLAGVAGGVGTALLPLESFAQHLEGQRVGTRSDRFSRMFDLPSFAEPTPRIQEALIESRLGGLDGRRSLHEGPIRLITNPELSPRNRDNPAATAGVTFRAVSRPRYDLRRDVEAWRTHAARARVEYPDTRVRSGFGLWRGIWGTRTRTPHAKFKVAHGLFEDLPRGTDGRAIIADPRNDENLMIAGLQVAFMLFHNRVVDRLRDDGEDRRLAAALVAEGGFKLREREEDDRRRAVFLEARRLVTWHYHWIIVNEFLPQIIGRSLVNDILSHGLRFYTPRPGRQSIPRSSRPPRIASDTAW